MIVWNIYSSSVKDIHVFYRPDSFCISTAQFYRYFKTLKERTQRIRKGTNKEHKDKCKKNRRLLNVSFVDTICMLDICKLLTVISVNCHSCVCPGLIQLREGFWVPGLQCTCTTRGAYKWFKMFGNKLTKINLKADLETYCKEATLPVCALLVLIDHFLIGGGGGCY